ncbi:hypothetical protein AXE80_05545 [Wenyingzhuangia fucanilytica]|uniref:EF-hand domain-containing protein n=1 Tax=Wenyingzhuangia fucanilytica TaxID=1790137 RepID=A0A1B1Y4S1_9FLAO|nr:YHYH protein [Wenyingzhuangia fucanilytica]ANW95776.1 hypothetical protein AXE80_05545 [Wenyingzhuangia fucanilytica]
MNKKHLIVGAVVLSVLASCHSHKKSNTHSHDGHTHGADEAHQHDYFGDYDLEDESFGTKTKVTITNNKRVMVTNSLPDHETGEFPRKGNPNRISAQNKTYEFPLQPKWIGEPQWVREPGVAINGVKFEPGTAEVVVCETGENYKVEAFQNLIDLGLDFNNAHVQPTGAYHYHGSPTSMIKNNDTGEDLIHIGFAHDGYPIYYSKSKTYKSSYKLVDGNREGEDCTYSNPKKTIDVPVVDHHDGTYTSDFEYVEGAGDLDECNGITIDGKYMYLVTDEFPYVSRCLMGEVAQEERRRPRDGNSQRGRREGGERPNFTQILQHMDANKDGKLSKDEVKGPLKDGFSKLDTDEDGFISEQEFDNAPRPTNGSQRR